MPLASARQSGRRRGAVHETELSEHVEQVEVDAEGRELVALYCEQCGERDVYSPPCRRDVAARPAHRSRMRAAEVRLVHAVRAVYELECRLNAVIGKGLVPGVVELRRTFEPGRADSSTDEDFDRVRRVLDPAVPVVRVPGLERPVEHRFGRHQQPPDAGTGPSAGNGARLDVRWRRPVLRPMRPPPEAQWQRARV